ncbi:MAG: hypothetical protein WBD67_11320 [Terracidiphilus sp.]
MFLVHYRSTRSELDEYRASIAASILHQYGITNLIEMAGGLAAWDAAKLPVVSEDRRSEGAEPYIISREAPHGI